MSIDLPTVTSIGKYVFYDCISLNTVNLPGITCIPPDVFLRYYSSLVTVNIPNVESIGYGAFHYCKSLTTIDLPKAIDVNDDTFYECINLKELHFAAKNKDVIEASDGYSNKFGATNATIYFDL